MQDSCAPPKPIFKSPHTGKTLKHRNLMGFVCTVLQTSLWWLQKFKQNKTFFNKFNSKDKFWTIYSLFPWKLLAPIFRIKWGPSNPVVVQTLRKLALLKSALTAWKVPPYIFISVFIPP